MRRLLFAAGLLAGLGGIVATSPAFADDATATAQRPAGDDRATGGAPPVRSAMPARRAPESVFAPSADLFATRSHGHP